MRATLYLVFLVLMFGLHAQQLEILPIKQRTKKDSASLNPLTIPFWDDFSTAGDHPDTLLWQYGANIFVNETLGINPPSYKVATFDGLDQFGKAYNISGEFAGRTDSLISQPIDLAGADQSSTFLSFYWQAKGLGEIPDEEDSIKLQFFTIDSVWVTVWSMNGGFESVDSSFQQVMLPIEGSRYFHQNFRFKFFGKTSLTGPFDTWHLDYIYLNENRSADRPQPIDRTLSGSQSLLFAPYASVHAEHFLGTAGQKFSQQSVLAANLQTDFFPLVFFYEVVNLTTQEAYFPLDCLSSGQLAPWEIRSFVGEDLPRGDSVKLDPLDSQVIQSTFTYLTGDDPITELDGNGNPIVSNIDLRANDTIKTQYLLHNFYAYDDGVAEFAAGINLLRGQVALRYIIPQRDTLNHIQIYFPDISPDAAGSALDLLVWGSDLSDDGIRMRQPITIAKQSGLNQFTEIKLTAPLIVGDTFHIGYQQFTDNYIAVGFDRNNTAAKGELFINTTGEWVRNARLEGVLMIRPVFKRDTTVILRKKAQFPSLIEAYPNPTAGIVSFSKYHKGINIFSLTGQQVYSSTYQEVYDLHFLPNGLYLIKIDGDQKYQTVKLLISR